MAIASLPDGEAATLPRSLGMRVKYTRPGFRTVIGDLIAVTDDAILVRVPRHRDPVACWTHGTFSLASVVITDA